MIRHRLLCTLHMLKNNKPHIYIRNKSMPLLLGGIRPFISLLPSSKLSVRSVHNGSSPSTPVKKYENADLDKIRILQENNGKAGVYR